MAKEKFEEIDVERINIIEPDGTLRLTIAGNARTPDPIFEGTPQDRTGSRGAGMIFFNDNGFECGGLTFMGNDSQAGAGLTLDRYETDQVVMLAYEEKDGVYGTTLMFVDRPTTPVTELWAKYRDLSQLEDGPEKEAKFRELWEGVAVRASLGRGAEGAAALQLHDTKGKPRIKLFVGADDEPHLQFLDAEGNVTFSLPPE